MTEQNTQAKASGNWQEQRRNKPQIEDLISEVIADSDMRKAALDFIAHLRKSNFGIVWSASNEWWVTLYCRAKCKITLRDDCWADDECLSKYSWVVSLRLDRMCEYEDTVASENLQDYINTYDPDEKSLKSIKRLLDLEKKATIADQKGNSSLYQKQKAVKPAVEDIIPEYLDGDMEKAALDFAAWLRENKLAPGWTLTNTWNVSCKGKKISLIGLGEEVWCNSKFWRVELRLLNMSEYVESISDEGVHNIIWNGIKYCTSCSGCAPGRDVTLFGKECIGLCHLPDVIVCDPDEETVESIKRLIELERKARVESK